MTAETYSTWLKKIGPEATKTLNFRQHAVFVIWPACLIGVLGTGWAFPHHLYLVGILSAVLAVVVFLFWISILRHLAKQLSAYYGFRVTVHEMPLFRQPDFDIWLDRKKNHKPLTKRWGIGPPH